MSVSSTETNMPEDVSARRRRVEHFLNAAASLRRGDLEAILKLEQVVPMEEDPPACLQTNDAHTGRELASILEDRLVTILCLGAASLGRIDKSRTSGELGGRVFFDDEKPDRPQRAHKMTDKGRGLLGSCVVRLVRRRGDAMRSASGMLL
jgi:hypothetical protein